MTPFGTGSPASEPLYTQLNQTFDNGQYQSRYHVFAGGLDRSRPVGLMIFADGSGGAGFTNPNSSYQLDADGQDGLVAVARKHNLVLVTPIAPPPGCDSGDSARSATAENANCWYDRDNAPGKAQWSSDLLHHVKSQLKIQPSRVVVGGYSSGAQWATQFFAPAHAEEHSVDLTVAIGYGGAPATTPRFSEAFKAQTAFAWDTGTADNAYRTDHYGSVGGYNWYTGNGFTTQATWPERVDHSRPGQFDQIMDREISRFLGGHLETDDSTAPGATRRTAIASQEKYDASDIVSRMSDASAGAYRRRPRGAAVGASKLYVRIDPDAASIVDQVAVRLGVSKAEFVERLMFHVGNTLDADGRPPWWPKSPPSPQELPMTD